MLEFKLLTVVVHKKEPVSTPRDISFNWSKPGNLHRDVGSESITRHIRHFHFSNIVEMRRHDSDRRLESMFTRTDAVKMGQRRDHADRAVSAHSQISGAIEENDPGDTRLVNRSTQQCTHDAVHTTRFIHDRAAEVVVIVLEALETMGQ